MFQYQQVFTENIHIPLFRKLSGDYKLLYISGHFCATYIEMALGRIYILNGQRKWCKYSKLHEI